MRITLGFMTLVVALSSSSCSGVLHGMQGHQYRLKEECIDAWNHHHTEPVGRACEFTQYRRLPRELDTTQPIDAALEVLSWDLAQPTVLAYAYDRVTRLDVVALHAAFDQLPDAVDREMTSRFDRRRRDVIAAVEAVPQRWRDVFLAPALRARAAWRKQEQADVAWLRRVDALAAEVDDALLTPTRLPAALAAVTAAHREYLAVCRQRGDVETCLGDAVARPLSLALIRLERAAGDGLAADADTRFLLAADASDGAFAEYDAARAAVVAEANERAAWEAATHAGMDPAAIARRWPEEPFAVRDDAPIWFGRRRDEARRAMPGRLYQVERVRRSGDRATLTFRKWVTGGYVATNCRETRRVDRIEAGRVIYREVCSGQQWMSTDRTARPANVPWAEVSAVRRHEVVRLVLDGERRGHVVEVLAGDARTPHELDGYKAPVVQLRDIRLRR